jgi:hypothetical protein
MPSGMGAAPANGEALPPQVQGIDPGPVVGLLSDLYQRATAAEDAVRRLYYENAALSERVVQLEQEAEQRTPETPEAETPGTSETTPGDRSHGIEPTPAAQARVPPLPRR